MEADAEMVWKYSNSVYITINLYWSIILGLFYNKEIRPIITYFKNSCAHILFTHKFFHCESISLDQSKIRYTVNTVHMHKNDTEQMRRLLVSIAIVYGDYKHNIWKYSNAWVKVTYHKVEVLKTSPFYSISSFLRPFSART